MQVAPTNDAEAIKLQSLRQRQSLQMQISSDTERKSKRENHYPAASVSLSLFLCELH